MTQSFMGIGGLKDHIGYMFYSKKFITIKDTMYDNLFNWIFDIAKKRVETPIDQSFGIDANSYDGWTIK